MSSENWDSYPATVDGSPASILVALHLEHGPRPESAETLYVAGIKMQDPGDHGMGTREEAESFAPFEDAVTATLGSPFVAVGRMRSGSTWQLSYYGPKDSDEAFFDALREHAPSLDRELWTHIDHDPEWEYFTDFLLPDAERRRWMASCRLVDRLIELGDRTGVPRLVDHGLYFPSAELRLAFQEAAQEAGFGGAAELGPAKEDGSYFLEVSREDTVELEHIHGVVMELIELAEPYRGEYDGWATPLMNETK